MHGTKMSVLFFFKKNTRPFQFLPLETQLPVPNRNLGLWLEAPELYAVLNGQRVSKARICHGGVVTDQTLLHSVFGNHIFSVPPFPSFCRVMPTCKLN